MNTPAMSLALAALCVGGPLSLAFTGGEDEQKCDARVVVEACENVNVSCCADEKSTARATRTASDACPAPCPDALEEWTELDEAAFEEAMEHLEFEMEAFDDELDEEMDDWTDEFDDIFEELEEELEAADYGVSRRIPGELSPWGRALAPAAFAGTELEPAAEYTWVATQGGTAAHAAAEHADAVAEEMRVIEEMMAAQGEHDAGEVHRAHAMRQHAEAEEEHARALAGVEKARTIRLAEIDAKVAEKLKEALADAPNRDEILAQVEEALSRADVRGKFEAAVAKAHAKHAHEIGVEGAKALKVLGAQAGAPRAIGVGIHGLDGHLPSGVAALAGPGKKLVIVESDDGSHQVFELRHEGDETPDGSFLRFGGHDDAFERKAPTAPRAPRAPRVVELSDLPTHLQFSPQSDPHFAEDGARSSAPSSDHGNADLDELKALLREMRGELRDLRESVRELRSELRGHGAR